MSSLQNNNKFLTNQLGNVLHYLLIPGRLIDKPVNTGNEYQLDIGSASNINVPLYLRAAHQKTLRDNPARPPNQFNNGVFDNVDVKRFVVEIDVIRYPKNPIEKKILRKQLFRPI